jgi:hypothetical protein
MITCESISPTRKGDAQKKNSEESNITNIVSHQTIKMNKKRRNEQDTQNN